MKNKTMAFIMILLIVVVGGFIFAKGNNTNNVVLNNENVGERLGEGQKIVLSQEDLNYKDIVADAGKPIVISADNSVRGCLRSVVFNINGKKYSKYLRSSEDTLQLPALSKGTYTFSCSMGMGFGKLIVK